MKTLVVRFSSLGDIVLCGSVTGALGDVGFITSRRYADLAASLPGVVEVIAQELGEGLGTLARRIPPDPVVIDLHGNLRARLLCARLPNTVRRLQRHDLRRRLRVAFKVRPPPDLVRRYGEAAGVVPLRPPWFQVAGPRDTLLLVPGASRATKRWPVERYAEVGGTWGGAVLCLGGPDDEGLCAELARRVGPRAEILCERGFTRTLAALGRARVALGNDTGITHLCAAAGLPTFVLFGPTTVEDGFWADRAVPLGADLPCRPCARFGRDSCPFGDHLCMESLETSFVLSRLERFRP